METKFNFNSQVCTSKVQSERLLALGLKKETADMYYSYDIICAKPYFKVEEFMNGCVPEDIFPAWSLHRLIEMIPQIIGHLELAINDAFVGYYEDRCESETGMYWEHTEESSNLYDNIISTIEWLIKEGYFNKEYLV